MIGQRKISIEDLPRYTVSEWKEWEGKWELIEGIPFSLLPMPNKRHQRINGKVYRLFAEQLENCPSCEAFLPVNFKIDDSNLLHPDLTIVCGEEKGGTYVIKTPSLVVEIVSKSTRSRDEITKPKVYSGLGIRYYVILYPKKEIAKIFELSDMVYDLRIEGRDIQYTFEFEECEVVIEFGKLW